MALKCLCPSVFLHFSEAFDPVSQTPGMLSNRNSNQQITTTASSNNAASPRTMSAEAKQEANSEFYLWSCAKKSVAGRLYGVTLKCMISLARGSRHRSSTDGCSRNCSKEKLSRCNDFTNNFTLHIIYISMMGVFKSTVKYVATGSVYVEYCCSSWTFLSIYMFRCTVLNVCFSE